MINDRLVLQRRRTLGEIVSDSFALWSKNWKVFAAVVGPAVMIQILFGLVTLLIAPDFDSTSTSDTLTDEELNQLLKDTALFGGIALLFLPFIWVFYQLTTAAVVVVLSALGEGKEINAGDALDAAQDRTKDLLVASLKSTLIIFLWCITIVGIPIALKRGIQWSLTIQSIMLDNVRGGESLAYSAALIKGGPAKARSS